MNILLDIDGVLVITPSWKKAEIHADGFLKFDDIAFKNLIKLVNITNASIILTTTHRINYTIDQWIKIFNGRGLNINSISKINEASTINEMVSRASEIKKWVDDFGDDSVYLVIDDDSSLNGLPEFIKKRCIITNSITGFNNDAFNKALSIII